MKYLTKFLHQHAKFFTNEHDPKRMILGLIFLLLCSLILWVKSFGEQTHAAVTIEHTAVMPVPAMRTITATKWWLKMTVTTSPSMLSLSTASVESKTANCSELSPATLRAKMFAYVALEPPLPNRLRAKASLSGEYIGKIESGVGLRVIDGPTCADGYSWWLVESLDKRLRGWTVEGRNSEQWIMPCPNVEVQCSFLATPTPTRAFDPHDNPVDPTENTCKSERLAIGMLAHVHQDSLLVIRAEPSLGAVAGHAGPMSLIRVMDGPACASGSIWWKVNALDWGIIGWTTENYLEACPKDSQCDQ
jgi:hypothetical protein